ncbi:tetratricopeptide repeat protein [Leptolyngbya sp. FACHB-261]|uniref:tetratricopeptide repeat protein n=1 Tax=Leptolyngbya sp. FACHB-261 TaxID=2692806 RepID=UPI00168A1CCA|nr:tetratricopeptide repeat protein [Leptolyngbya sp. FACHB-261]MBD2100468.1 tetratricopeptide repeat protein [Leptolyngbya sp. FACHB-261]
MADPSPLLSFCAIVKNEVQQLAGCLESVRGVADELIVLDTGSTDGTPELAAQLGAQVFHFPWCDDFAIARNQSLSYAKGQWVLVLDADETLLPEFVPTLRTLLAQTDYLAFNLVRQEVGASQSPYSLVSRLFRNRPDVCFSRPYHAMIDDSVAEVLARQPQLKVATVPQVAIAHTGYSRANLQARDKLNFAARLMESYRAKHPQDPYVCSKLGALYVEAGDLERGIDLLDRALAGQPDNPQIQFELHYHRAIAASQQGDWAGAAHHYQQALALPVLEPLKLGAYLNLSSLLHKQGNFQGAIGLCEKALAVDPQFANAYYNLGLALKATGKLVEASRAYQRAIELEPEHANAYQNLGVVLMHRGQLAQAAQVFSRAIELHQAQNRPQAAEQLRQGLQGLGMQLPTH